MRQSVRIKNSIGKTLFKLDFFIFLPFNLSQGRPHPRACLCVSALKINFTFTPSMKRFLGTESTSIGHLDIESRIFLVCSKKRASKFSNSASINLLLVRQYVPPSWSGANFAVLVVFAAGALTVIFQCFMHEQTIFKNSNILNRTFFYIFLIFLAHKNIKMPDF